MDAGTDASRDAEPEQDADTSTKPAVPSTGCEIPAEEREPYVSVSTGTVEMWFPSGYDDGAPLPLIIGFHATNYRMAPILTDRDGPFVDAYVIAMPNSPSPGIETWEGLSRDVLGEIYDALEATFCFDTSHVYAIGHASGGRYLQSTFCDTSGLFQPTETFRAVALQGATNLSRCEQSALFPTVFIHADFDSVAQQYDEADNSGAVQSLIERNECEAEGTMHSGSCSSTSFECVDYDGCSAAFRSCRHDLQVGGSDLWPCFASEEIGRFFDEHR